MLRKVEELFEYYALIFFVAVVVRNKKLTNLIQTRFSFLEQNMQTNTKTKCKNKNRASKCVGIFGVFVDL